MVLNRFFIQMLVRVTLIVLSCLLLGIILPYLDQGYYYTMAGMLFLIVLQAYLLVLKVNQTNTDLEKFFMSVHNSDTSIQFSEDARRTSFRTLHERMNEVNKLIQDTKMQNERSSHFLGSLVDHLDVGLISFDHNGKIGIFNKTAGQYLNVGYLGDIESLKKKDVEMHKNIMQIKPGEEKLHRTKIDNRLQSLLLKAVEFKFDDETLKLVSLQNITNELDKKELDSWRKLIKVLTHEIMNSISPITSLTTVISDYFQKKDGKGYITPDKLDSQIVAKTLSGLATIEETGKGLLDFVDKYRSLTNLPMPEYSNIQISDLLKKCKYLMESNLAGDTEILVHVHPKDITLPADPAQIEQILINLINNAIDALCDMKEGTITLRSFYGDACVIVQVEDNGTGIPSEIIEDIFVPFYTTKKKGSGVGLSLSRQIMQNHHGTISVKSVSGKGTVFSLDFPLKT